MEGEGEGGISLCKRFNDNNSKDGGAEVDYKTKSGTAWSHSYLNQKPWHPLSYPNQRRKWIAEQTHSQRQRRTEEVAREYAQEQEFFRQTALISKKEKEKIEMMKAVSFMYVRPPGYNAESAKAAEIADEIKRDPTFTTTSQPTASSSNSIHAEPMPGGDKKKPRPKDAFGRPLPTQEEFEVLANAPRLETGVPARVKPFGIEVRNVKCLRCGKYGHQSGDRECPLKDVIMPNEESRLKRDDPLTAIMAQTDPTEPLKWELKKKPGRSPPRGGFNPDDPNQQIVTEDIFDEYGGFLSGGNIPDLLTNFSPNERKKKSKKRKHKKDSSPSRESEASDHRLSSPSNKANRRDQRAGIIGGRRKGGQITLNRFHPMVLRIGVPIRTGASILIHLKILTLSGIIRVERPGKNIISRLNLIVTDIEVRTAEKFFLILLNTVIRRGIIEVKRAGTSNLIHNYPMIRILVGIIGVKIILAATATTTTTILIHSQNEFAGVLLSTQD